ncbi:hypothetical protein ACFVT2_02705 [Streptomyces sp. NPDC058000]|uniref:hypothetical protein n=1 Tax=Streptomyces sp. NPDC058000 TaxID=3346299 RepID=UPI0036E5899D
MTGPAGPLPPVAWSTVRFGAGAGAAAGVPVLLGWRSADGAGLARAWLLVCREAPGRGPVRPAGDGVPDVHLWADPDGGPGGHWAEFADVLVTRTALPPGAARKRARALLARHPGALVAVVPHTAGGCVVAVRGAPVVWCAGPGARPSRPPVPPCLVGSVLHAWLAAGGPLGAVRAVLPGAPTRAAPRQLGGVPHG